MVGSSTLKLEYIPAQPKIKTSEVKNENIEDKKIENTKEENREKNIKTIFLGESAQEAEYNIQNMNKNRSPIYRGKEKDK